MVSVRNVPSGFTEVTAGAAITGLAGRVYELFLLLIGFVAAAFLIWYGIQYITSQGSQDTIKKARQGIINSVIGIVIVVSAYAFIRAGTYASQMLNNLSSPVTATATPRPSASPTPTPRPGSSIGIAEYRNAAYATLNNYGYDDALDKYCYVWKDASNKSENCMDPISYNYYLPDCISNRAQTRADIYSCVSTVSGRDNGAEWLCRAYKEENPTLDCPYNNE